MVDIGGFVIILTSDDEKIRLYGTYAAAAALTPMTTVRSVNADDALIRPDIFDECKRLAHSRVLSQIFQTYTVEFCSFVFRESYLMESI